MSLTVHIKDKESIGTTPPSTTMSRNIVKIEGSTERSVHYLHQSTSNKMISIQCSNTII